MKPLVHMVWVKLLPDGTVDLGGLNRLFTLCEWAPGKHHEVMERYGSPNFLPNLMPTWRSLMPTSQWFQVHAGGFTPDHSAEDSAQTEEDVFREITCPECLVWWDRYQSGWEGFGWFMHYNLRDARCHRCGGVDGWFACEECRGTGRDTL